MMLFRRTETESFRVFSGRSGNEVACFADCRVAFDWIKERYAMEGPHGPGYYVKDRHGREVPPLPTDGVLGTSDNRVPVDRGALQMALNVLRRAGKTEVAGALEQSADGVIPSTEPQGEK